MNALRFPRRRHELALIALLLAAVGLIGFWLGRATAPDTGVAYLRGKADGHQSERRRIDQNEIDSNILDGEAEAARREQPQPSANEQPAERVTETATIPVEDERPPATAVGATN